QDVLSVGGYKSDTFAEDADLTLRLVTGRGRVVYEPLMEVHTEIPEQMVPLIKQRYRWNRGILQAVRKHVRRGMFVREPHVAIVVLYMMTETMILPVANVAVTLMSLFYQVLAMDFSLLSLWLAVLLLLDLAVLLVTLVDHRWPLK